MIEPSIKRNIPYQWFRWHYFEVPKKLSVIFWNFLVFNFNFFSIELLFKTLFSHWRQYREFYARGFDPVQYTRVFVGNMISRAIGAIIRTLTIALGLAFEATILVIVVSAFLFWLLLPLIVVSLFFSASQLLIGL